MDDDALISAVHLQTLDHHDDDLLALAAYYGAAGGALNNSDLRDNVRLAAMLQRRGGPEQLALADGSSGDDGYLVRGTFVQPVEIKSILGGGKFNFLHRNSEKTLERLVDSGLLCAYWWSGRLLELWLVEPGSSIHRRFEEELLRIREGRPIMKKDGSGPRKNPEPAVLVGITEVRAAGRLLIYEPGRMAGGRPPVRSKRGVYFGSL